MAWPGAELEAGLFGAPPHRGTPVECLWPAGEGGQGPGLPDCPGSPGVPEHPEGPVNPGGHTVPAGQRAAGGRCKTPCPRSHCCSARLLQSCLQHPARQARGGRSGAEWQMKTYKRKSPTDTLFLGQMLMPISGSMGRYRAIFCNDPLNGIRQKTSLEML